MNDLISRQATIDLVRDVCDAIMSICGSHYDPETEDEVYDDIREVDAILKCNKEIRIALEHLQPAQPDLSEYSDKLWRNAYERGKRGAQPDPQWIPCSERLPENKSYVLTTIYVPGRQPHARSGWFEDELFMNDNGDTWKSTDREVCAWMPLPEPYRGEGEEK